MTLSNRWNRTIYRLYAPVYDQVARPFERGRSLSIDRVDPDPDDRILLVGAGTGLDLEHLSPGPSVTALDLVGANVRRTGARADALDREVDALVGDAGALPFEDDSFDVVLLHLLLSVVPDPHAAAAEAARVLAPDGRIAVFDKFVPEGTEPSLLRRALNPVARVLFSDLTRRLEPILADTGLVVDRQEWVLGDLYTVAILRPTDDDLSVVDATVKRNVTGESNNNQKM